MKKIAILKTLVIGSIIFFNYNKVVGQVINGGFEEWETIEESIIKPVGWQQGYGFFNYGYTFLKRDTLAVEGDYSLKIVPTPGLSSCETRLNHTRAIYTGDLGEHVSIFMYVRSISNSLHEYNDPYLQFFGQAFKNDTVIGSYNWLDTTEIETFTAIEIPIDAISPDSISFNIIGGANPTPIATDGCFDYTISWLDDIRVGPTTLVKTLSPSNEDEQKITCYPNPTKGDFSIKQKGTHYQQLEIYDLLGQLVLKKQLTTDVSPVHLTQKGVYFLKFKRSDQQKYIIKKVVVN